MRLDFWKFWTGETVSAFGTSITQFAMPLIVFKLTGSAVALGAAAAIFTVPHLMFGLAIGAWTDRTDRRRLMIAVDLLNAVGKPDWRRGRRVDRRADRQRARHVCDHRRDRLRDRVHLPCGEPAWPRRGLS